MGMFLLLDYDSFRIWSDEASQNIVHKNVEPLNSFTKLFQCSEFVICGGIALFSAGMIYYKYLEDLETKATTNKPYKEYYTVYRPNDPRIQRLRQEWYKDGAPPMTTCKVD